MEYDVDDVVKVREAYGIVTGKTLHNDGTIEYAVKALAGPTMWLVSEEGLSPSDRGFTADVIAFAKTTLPEASPFPINLASAEFDHRFHYLCDHGEVMVSGHHVSFAPKSGYAFDAVLSIYWIRLNVQK